MSFRLFIYYCALCGGWAAWLGWVLGRWSSFRDPLIEASVKGLCLGLLIALALSMVDGLCTLGLARADELGLRITMAAVIGSVGGMFGGVLGQALLGWQPLALALILGWTVTGLLIGASIGSYDVLVGYVRHEDLHGAWRKARHGLLGGAVGGLLGGCCYTLLFAGFRSVFQDKPVDRLWVPSGAGFVALGLCIGLMIGLAQIILKEAWVRIETGRRAGREMLLTKPDTLIGRAEASDIGIFGDPGVAKTHARIVLQDRRYLLVDTGSPGGTFINGQRIEQPTPLHSGDQIRVGASLLQFGERRKA